MFEIDPLTRSKQLQRQLDAATAELERLVGELRLEVERLGEIHPDNEGNDIGD